jgi:hypothetical protein
VRLEVALVVHTCSAVDPHASKELGANSFEGA